MSSSDSINFFKTKLKKCLQDIDPQAVSIIKRLKDAGFDGYIVGGGVRDLLVGLRPKDFDIATNALPNEVKRKVPYSFIIGRRFKLVHARRGEKIFEIATYRREATDEELASESIVDAPYIEENFFGTLQEDSFRRDFTINALFYDPISENLIDHCSGLQDLLSHTIRMIGEPQERIKEDPIRILRALRLSQKLHFQISPDLREAIHILAEELQKSALPRRREEWLKFLKLDSIDAALMELYDLQIFKHIIPTFEKLFSEDNKREEFLCYVRRFEKISFDQQNPTELLAALIYSYLLAEFDHFTKININEISLNSSFYLFCKDELGVFKAEFGSIVLAIQYIAVLKKQDSYLKKGERRQKAMLNNQNFNLAMKLGLLSGELSSTDFVFWMQEKERLKDII